MTEQGLLFAATRGAVPLERESKIATTLVLGALRILAKSLRMNRNVYSNAHKVIAGFFLSPEPEVT
jgi:hypothetical protein